MSHHDDEFQPVLDRLNEERPELSAPELEDISRRVRARVAARKRPRSALMKSRLTILAMLVAGILLSTAGAGLAVSGISSSGDAGVAQYGEQAPANTSGGDVLGEQQSGGGGASQPAQAAQPARQVAASSEGLPFTGYAALPVLIGGVALLGGGLVLRQRTRGQRS